MPNYGLLEGLATGLREGVSAYRDESRYRDKKKQEDKLYKAGLLQHGFEESPEGELGLSKLETEKRNREAGDKSLENEIDIYKASPDEYKPILFEKLVKKIGSRSSGLLSPDAPSKELASGEVSPQPQKPAGLISGLPRIRSKEEKEVDLAVKKAKAIKEMESEQARKEASDPKLSLNKMSAEAKGKLGLIKEGMASLGDYQNAFNAGQRQRLLTPDAAIKIPWIGKLNYGSLLTGSTDIDRAKKMMIESIGRLHSQGTINDAEMENFSLMLPTNNDTDDQAIKKLEQYERLMKSKLEAFGIDEETAKIPPRPGLLRAQEPKSLGADPRANGSNLFLQRR